MAMTMAIDAASVVEWAGWVVRVALAVTPWWMAAAAGATAIREYISGEAIGAAEVVTLNLTGGGNGR